MRDRSWIWSATLAVTIAACASRHASAPPAQPAPPPAETARPPGGGMCPMMIDPATTQITTSDTSDGVAITFTTTGDVNALRARVRQMAEMHNRMAGMQGGGMQGGGMQRGGMQGGGMQGGMMHMQMVPSRATVEEIPGGARLVLVPVDPTQVASLRQHARVHAEMMQKGKCPMMAQPGPVPEGQHEHHRPGGA